MTTDALNAAVVKPLHIMGYTSAVAAKGYEKIIQAF
jgi:hypothetical protein